MAMSAAGIFVGSPGFVTSKMPIGEFLHANPLQVARISNIDTKLVAGEIPLGGLLKQVAASSGRAYAIGHGERNLISLDVSNPTLPRLLDTSPTGCPVNGLASWQGYGYVLRPRGGWDIYGTPDGENLEKLGTIKSATTPEIAFSGNFAFTTDSTSFVQVVNVASPAAAQTLAKIDLGSRVVRLASGGRYVYAYLENGMIDVVDAANGAIPAKISEVAATIPVTQMYAQGQYLYARGASALRVFDVSNPSSPALLSTLDSQLSFWQFGVAGRYAYFAAGSSVNIMDVLNPASPEMVQTIGNLSRPGAIPTLARSGAQSISTSGENALVAGALGVLVIGPTPAPTPKRNTQLK
jgi:hypothetical protein